jgi:hypothetical protein
MRVRVIAALASAAVFSCGAAGSAQTTMPPVAGPAASPTATMPAEGPLALEARDLRGTRTAHGYRLTAEALVNDPCMAARFTRFLGTIFPPYFNVVQFRRPDMMGKLCIQRLAWVTMPPLDVASAAPPRYVTVRTKKGSARVPILAVPLH